MDRAPRRRAGRLAGRAGRSVLQREHTGGCGEGDGVGVVIARSVSDEAIQSYKISGLLRLRLAMTATNQPASTEYGRKPTISPSAISVTSSASSAKPSVAVSDEITPA